MLRNFLKRKGFTLINLLGLSTGMAVCLLLALYIQNELGYDNFHEHGNQIYRLAFERKYPGRTALKGEIPHSIGQVVKKEFPEVLESTRVIDYNTSGAKVTVGDKIFTEKKIFMVDSNFFRVFGGQFVEGDGTAALQKPGTAVLTENTAKIYFGSVQNAMGKQIILDEFRKCVISGVCRDWPEKSHFQFDILITTSGNTGLNIPNYVYFGPHTYLLLNSNASAAALEAKLPLIVDKYVAPSVPKLFGESYKQFVAEGNGYRYFLQPLQDIHLHSELEDEFRPSGSMRNILLLCAIAAFILLLACVNFVNLSTAISVERAKEVGVRKTFGSRKIDLTWQFLTESILFSLVSMLFSLLLAALFTPLLSNISGNELHFSYFLHPFRLLLVLGFSILIGCIAGLYPALILSSFDPMMVLKGRFTSNGRGIALRNGLVIFQFAISVILIICTIGVNRQMQYMLGDRLGFKKDHIITVDGMWRLMSQQKDSRQTFIDEIARTNGVEDITECSMLPGNDDSGGGSTWVAVDNNASRTERVIEADDRYLKLLDLQLREGRFFSGQSPTDSFAVILNESAVKDFGLKNPIGARLISQEPDYNPAEGEGHYTFTVIGVIKDFHFQSLRKKIAPLVITNSNKFWWGSIGVRISSDHFQSTVSEIGKTWTRFDPKHDFRFSFLDRNVADQYKSEQTEQKIFNIFSLLAIIIACIGLFGLSAFSARQRRKEIGIRKVLGAMPANIIMILSGQFLRLIIIASLIAFPLAYWAMHRWLQDFAYRIDISWWIFALAGGIALSIAFLTISFQAVRAAMINPVKSLRTE